MRSPEGQQLIQRLIVDAGILITNVAGRQWHSHDAERAAPRPDPFSRSSAAPTDRRGLHRQRRPPDFLVTGSPDQQGPVEPRAGLGRQLWAVRGHRDPGRAAPPRQHRAGQRDPAALDDVALATAANLGFLTEVMVTGTQRPRLGNAIYGQYGQNFSSSDGAWFMIVALTNRHFRDLTELTGTTESGCRRGRGVRRGLHRRRAALRSIARCSAGCSHRGSGNHTADDIAVALSGTSILWNRYQTFAEAAESPRVTANPLFAPLEQPRVGSHLAPGLPMSVDGAHTIPALPWPSATTPPPFCPNGSA